MVFGEDADLRHVRRDVGGIRTPRGQRGSQFVGALALGDVSFAKETAADPDCGEADYDYNNHDYVFVVGGEPDRVLVCG